MKEITNKRKRNHRTGIAISVILLVLIGGAAFGQHVARSGQVKKANQNLSEAPLSSFKITASENLLNPGHLYSKSSGTSVEINQRELGIGNVICPPFFCYPFSGKLLVGNKKVKVADFEWYPAGTTLTGIMADEIVSSLKIVPLAAYRGVLAEVILTNNSARELEVPVEWVSEGRVGKSENWEWYPPFAMKSIPEEIQLAGAAGACQFINQKTVTLVRSDQLIPDPQNPQRLVGKLVLKPRETKSVLITMLVGDDAGQLRQNAEWVLKNPLRFEDDAFKRCNQLLTAIESKAPGLSGATSDLSDFYRKGLLTFLTCRWEVGEFISSPWYAESGIDGGALNNYCWGIAYISRLMSVIDPAAVRRLLIEYATADLQKAYALNPANGKGMGVLYSYNYYSIARATHDYITITGDVDVLKEKIGAGSYLDYLWRFCLSNENMKNDPDLIDYGDNSNLLELKRTSDYCHYTPSPNAERLLIYRYLNDFYGWSGRIPPDNLDERGGKLRTIFQEKLWDPERKWLFSLDELQQPRTAYSLQVFDVLRTGALTKDQEAGIVSHLNQKEFLSDYGVHSLAKTDEGYDSSDVDWGGPGVYTGDAPELVEDLLQEGFTDQGMDVLKRILWWGKFPYYPQAIRADKPGYREDGRPNEIAGLAASQAVVFALFGITVDDSSLTIRPVNHSFMKGLSLNGLLIRGRKFDISVSGDNTFFTVSHKGKKYRSTIGEAVKIELPELTKKSFKIGR